MSTNRGRTSATLAKWAAGTLCLAIALTAWWILSNVFVTILWENHDNPEDHTALRIWRERAIWASVAIGTTAAIAAIPAGWFHLRLPSPLIYVVLGCLALWILATIILAE